MCYNPNAGPEGGLSKALQHPDHCIAGGGERGLIKPSAGDAVRISFGGVESSNVQKELLRRWVSELLTLQAAEGLS